MCEGDDEEHREAGHVRWQVHVSYMRATGWLMTAIILSSLILMQVCFQPVQCSAAHRLLAVFPQARACNHLHMLCRTELPVSKLSGDTLTFCLILEVKDLGLLGSTSSCCFMQATRNGSDLWLSYWVANVEEDFRSHPLLSEPPRPPLPPSRILMIPQIDRSMALPITPLRMHPFLPAWKHPNEHQHHAAQKLGMVEKGWGLGWAWLPPETSFYFSVLLLIAAANSLFTMVRLQLQAACNCNAHQGQTCDNVMFAVEPGPCCHIGHAKRRA